jgi:acetate kinase
VPGRPLTARRSGTIDEVEDHGVAAEYVVADLRRDRVTVDAVGHRVVHGSTRFAEPVLLDDGVIDALESLAGMAPLHNERALAAILATRAVLAVPQVGVFDTAFHRSMPLHAARDAVPSAWTRHEVQRFGFHGLAHRWMGERHAARAGVEPVATRLITLQLGSGCSAAALIGGRSVDTTMGLTPLEGLMMATRSGDIDPAVVPYIAEREGITAAEVVDQLNHAAGLRGVSDRSGDVRELLAAEAEGDERAALALTMFCYRTRKAVGSYLAALGGADAVVFGGGVGEHQPEIRRRVLAGLEGLGIELDAAANAAAVGSEATISTPASAIRVDVIPVDEATVIATDTAAALRGF